MPTNKVTVVCSTSDTYMILRGEQSVGLIAGDRSYGGAVSADIAPDSNDITPRTRVPRSDDGDECVPASAEARSCIGPGRNGAPFCGKPKESRRTLLCVSHSLQMKKHGSLQPLRTRTSKSTCIGPGQDGGICGRQVYVRPVGQDDGICKTHYDQQKRSGTLKPIERRMAPIPDRQCWGPVKTATYAAIAWPMPGTLCSAPRMTGRTRKTRVF